MSFDFFRYVISDQSIAHTKSDLKKNLNFQNLSPFYRSNAIFFFKLIHRQMNIGKFMRIHFKNFDFEHNFQFSVEK